MSENRAVGQGSQALVPIDRLGRKLAVGVSELPDFVHRAGQAAVFAAEEFFDGTIRNENTVALTATPSTNFRPGPNSADSSSSVSLPNMLAST